MDLLAQMATFVRIVDVGSLSAAARALRLSLPAVSRQLRALEDELGAPLLVRSTRRMSLTDAGRKWYEGATRILRDVEETRAQIESPDELRGTLVVSAGISIGLGLVVPHLPRLASRHPRLSIELRLEDRLADFVGEAVDLAIRGGVPPPDSSAYVAHPLTQFPRQLFAAPAYLKKHGTPRAPSDLAQHACLRQLSLSGPTVRWRLMRGDEPREIELRGPVSCNAPVALRDLACAGLGVALLPDWLAAEDVAAGRLRRVLPDWQGGSVATWAIYRVELRGTAKVRAFLEAVSARRA